MRLELLVGGPPDPDAAEYYRDLVAGAAFAAARFDFAAWTEPGGIASLVDGTGAIGELRRAAAHLALRGRSPERAGELFADEVVAEAWERGPEHYAGPAITGSARTGAYDHFLHHTGEPVVYSPRDFAPVVKDNTAPGGIVPSAPRLLAEVEELGRALGEAPDEAGSPAAQGLYVIAAAARAAVEARAALVVAYAG